MLKFYIPAHRQPEFGMQSVSFSRWLTFHAARCLSGIINAIIKPLYRVRDRSNLAMWQAIDPDDDIPF